MANFSSDYQGFLKFLTRAKSELISWFGPHFNNDARRIAYMASREWDAMDHMEKRFFIIATQPDHQINNPKRSRYLSFLMQKRFSSIDAPENARISPFDKNQSLQLSQLWKDLDEVERQESSSRSIVDIAMDHVLEQRSKLHETYDPLRLNTLEFLLKTEPRWPLSARVWFFKHHNLFFGSKTSSERWNNLDDVTKQVYDACAILDRKRFRFEKSAWLTKLVSLDLEDESLCLDDFKAPTTTANLDTVCTILESNKTTIPVELRKRRPRGPFSLFIEYHRYQIREEKPEFKFAEHLQSSAEAWSKLTEKQKDEFREQSQKLKEAWHQERMREDVEASIPKDLFSTRKTVHGPCHPSHLVPRRISLINLYGNMNKIPRADRKKSWESLSAKEQEVYRLELEKREKLVESQRHEIKKKVGNLKELLKEAHKLESIKVKMRLISSINKSVGKLQAGSD